MKKRGDREEEKREKRRTKQVRRDETERVALLLGRRWAAVIGEWAGERRGVNCRYRAVRAVEVRYLNLGRY